MSVFLPSLPAIARHFSADQAVVQLAVSLYLGTTAVLQLFIGPLSDRYGRRPIMLAFLCIALAATLLTIYAPTIEWLLVGRILQGSAVCGIVVSRAAIRDIVGVAAAASMIGYVTMGMTIAPMLGPVAGGYLDENIGWQAAFWLIFAFGAITLLLTWLDWGETNHTKSTSMRDQVRSYPELVRSRRFWGYSLTAGLSSAAFFVLLGGGPFLAVNYYHMPPSQYGLIFLFPAIGYLAGNFISARLATRTGINRMMFSGSLTLLVSLTLASCIILSGMDGALVFFGSTTFVGIANGTTLPSAIAGMVSVRPHLAGAAAGLGGFFQIGFGAGLAAVAAALLDPGKGPLALVLIMLASAAFALLSTLYVIQIDKHSEPIDVTPAP